MNNEDKDRARYAKLYCAIVEILESSGCKDSIQSIKEVLSIIVWVEQEIMQEKSRTLLWTAKLIETEYSKSEYFPLTHVLQRIKEEMINNEAELHRTIASEVSRLKEEIVDEGKR
jgi:hypothetical protein|nr:MAG TPA: hypothetical protein [Caudoviricetes sp.]DAT16183.1 MAG TPA: hypothetical protein [Caudoviricetes sp.]